MKTKFRMIALLTLSLVSLLMLSVNVNASAKHFNYFQNNGAKTLHKTYTSKKVYKINKTMKMASGYKLKVKNIHVYQVAAKKSAYRTWMKVTGTAYNKSNNGSFRFGTTNMAGLTSNSLIGLSNTATPFSFSYATSKSPKMLSNITGSAANKSTKVFLGANHSESFQLLLHSKRSVSPIGKANLFISTYTKNNASQAGAGTMSRKTISVNLK